MPAWEESYLGQLRESVGPGPVLMTVGARAVLRDPDGPNTRRTLDDLVRFESGAPFTPA